MGSMNESNVHIETKEYIVDYLYWEDDLNRTCNQLKHIDWMDKEDMDSGTLHEYNRCNARIDLLESKLNDIVNSAASRLNMSVNDFIDKVNQFTEKLKTKQNGWIG